MTFLYIQYSSLFPSHDTVKNHKTYPMNIEFTITTCYILHEPRVLPILPSNSERNPQIAVLARNRRERKKRRKKKRTRGQIQETSTGMVIKGQRSGEREGEESLLAEAGHVHPRSTFLARNVAAKPRQYACLCQGRGMMCRREGGSRCYARAWMGWFLGGCGREGNGLGSASRRGGELRGTRRRHDREDTGGGGVRGGERSLRRRYYSKPEDYQYPWEALSSSPVIKDGAYGDITELDGPLASSPISLFATSS